MTTRQQQNEDCTSLDRLDQAAVQAYTLIQTYADVPDPYSTSNENPWKNPQDIFSQLQSARKELDEAWNQVLIEQETEESKQQQQQQQQEGTNDFRALYMDMITDAFADVLEDLRNKDGNDEIDVDVLVDCLQSGMELLTADDRESFLRYFEEEDDNPNDDSNDDNEYHPVGDKKEDSTSATHQQQLTPHELHRRELGYDVLAS